MMKFCTHNKEIKTFYKMMQIGTLAVTLNGGTDLK